MDDLTEIEVVDLCDERQRLPYSGITLACTLAEGHDDDFHYDGIENPWWHDGGPRAAPAPDGDDG